MGKYHLSVVFDVLRKNVVPTWFLQTMKSIARLRLPPPDAPNDLDLLPIIFLVIQSLSSASIIIQNTISSHSNNTKVL